MLDLDRLSCWIRTASAAGADRSRSTRSVLSLVKFVDALLRVTAVRLELLLPRFMNGIRENPFSPSGLLIIVATSVLALVSDFVIVVSGSLFLLPGT